MSWPDDRLLAAGWSLNNKLPSMTCPSSWASCDLNRSGYAVEPCRQSAWLDCYKPKCCACRFCKRGRAELWTSPSGAVVETVATATQPPFVFAFNPVDADMRSMRTEPVVEPLISELWMKTTRPCCLRGGSVIDVGVNYGWYTLLSRSMGCSVVGFEPVAAFREVLQLSLHANKGFADGIVVHPNVVFDHPGKYRMVVPVSGPTSRRDPSALITEDHQARIGMTAMIGPKGPAAVKDVTTLEPDAIVKNESAEAVTIDGVVDTRRAEICMLKVDVEGLEPNVLRTARRLLCMSRVEAVLVEFTRKAAQKCDNIAMLRDMLLLGFNLYVMRKEFKGQHVRSANATSKFLLENASAFRIARQAGAGVIRERFRAAAYAALKAYRRVGTPFAQFSSNLFAWRGDYVPGIMLRNYRHMFSRIVIGC